MNFISPTILSLLETFGINDIVHHVHQVLSQRFRKENTVHISDWSVDLPCIDLMVASTLEAPFEEKEIYRALMESECDKAPEPSDFPFYFAQSFLNLFGEKIIGIFQECHSIADFNHRFSESFITLIPKN